MYYLNRMLTKYCNVCWVWVYICLWLLLRCFNKISAILSVISFIAGGNRITRKRPPTFCKSPTNLITYCCIEYTSLWTWIIFCARPILNYFEKWEYSLSTHFYTCKVIAIKYFVQFHPTEQYKLYHPIPFIIFCSKYV